MSGPLEIYDVVHNGHQTRMKLTRAQAERMGLVKKRAADNKARSVDDVTTKATSDPDLTCDECGFVAKTAGGLAAHQRSHEA